MGANDTRDGLPPSLPEHEEIPAPAEAADACEAAAAREAAGAGLPAALELLAKLDELRQDEGSTVELACSNPDFNGLPNEVVTVTADWTDWTARTFRADRLVDCFTLALEARAAARSSASNASPEETGPATGSGVQGVEPEETPDQGVQAASESSGEPGTQGGAAAAPAAPSFNPDEVLAELESTRRLLEEVRPRTLPVSPEAAAAMRSAERMLLIAASTIRVLHGEGPGFITFLSGLCRVGQHATCSRVAGETRCSCECHRPSSRESKARRFPLHLQEPFASEIAAAEKCVETAPVIGDGAVIRGMLEEVLDVVERELGGAGKVFARRGRHELRVLRTVENEAKRMFDEHGAASPQSFIDASDGLRRALEKASGGLS